MYRIGEDIDIAANIFSPQRRRSGRTAVASAFLLSAKRPGKGESNRVPCVLIRGTYGWCDLLQTYVARTYSATI